jgi:hypothetical protein
LCAYESGNLDYVLRVFSGAIVRAEAGVRAMRSGFLGRFWTLIVVAASLSLFAADASAQMNNKPYSFKGGSSLGMSSAARQAILNKKLTGATPDNIMRGADGSLIEISKGPGSTAVAIGSDGAVIPSYHGRGDAFDGAVGIFNPYFLGNSGQRSGSYSIASRLTGNAISGWTGMVTGSPVFLGGGTSSIDAWTSLIGG